MNLIGLLTSPWAIHSRHLLEIQSIFSTHLHGEKIDIASIEARLSKPLFHEQRDYVIHAGGVAVLNLSGIFAPKANLFTQVSGGVSTQIAQKQIESAWADSHVKSLILDIDSPGGSVLGIPELASCIKAMALEKPVVTVSSGTLCSAAYWVGSAANAQFISGSMVEVGSIGVVATHQFDPEAGKTNTEISAGKYKRICSNLAPLSSEGRSILQADVDYIYSVFVETIAQNKDVFVDAVLEHMADGRVFRGQAAIDAGLVNGYASVDDIAQQMAADSFAFSKRQKTQIKAFTPILSSPISISTPAFTSKSKGKPMSDSPPTLTRASLEADHPVLFAQLRTEFMTEGANAECARAKAVRAECLAGHEQLIETLATDGKTTASEAAQAVLAAERNLRAKAHVAHQIDAPQAAANAIAPNDTALTSAEKHHAAKAYATQNRCDYATALKALGYYS